MSKNIDLKPRNNKNQQHGYWEHYYDNGKLEFKGNYVNGQRHGLCESYHSDGELFYKGYYDMGIPVDYEVNVVTLSKEMFPIY